VIHSGTVIYRIAHFFEVFEDDARRFELLAPLDDVSRNLVHAVSDDCVECLRDNTLSRILYKANPICDCRWNSLLFDACLGETDGSVVRVTRFSDSIA
jgi:hypothetical protein